MVRIHAVGRSSSLLIGRFLVVLVIGLIVTGDMGCQAPPTISIRHLVRKRAASDLSGLLAPKQIDPLKVSWAVPDDWDALPLQRRALYSHQQWRSPSKLTGVGVAHIRLPLPVPAQALVWLARGEYLKKSRNANGEGKVLAQWTDSIGRCWFEAENGKYHVRGYALTRGGDAWIVYTGWRTVADPRGQEIALAGRSVDSVVPAN